MLSLMVPGQDLPKVRCLCVTSAGGWDWECRWRRRLSRSHLLCCPLTSAMMTLDVIHGWIRGRLALEEIPTCWLMDLSQLYMPYRMGQVKLSNQAFLFLLFAFCWCWKQYIVFLWVIFIQSGYSSEQNLNIQKLENYFASHFSWYFGQVQFYKENKRYRRNVNKIKH